MRIKLIHKVILSLISTVSVAATVSRVHNWADGEILFSTDLNAEFNNLIPGINNIDDTQISPSANIDPSKISAVIDGAGISRAPLTGQLSVNPDNVTIEVVADMVQLKNNAVTTAKIVDGSITLSKMATDSIDSSKIVDGSVTLSKIAPDSVDSSKIVNRSIIADDIGTGVITNNEMAANSITTSNVQNGQITQPKLAGKPCVGASAGVGQVACSGNSAAFTSASGAFVTVNSQSITVTTSSSGRPIMVMVHPYPNAGAGTLWAQPGNVCQYQITRPGFTWITEIGSTSNSGQNNSISIIDPDVAANTAYNYQFQVRNILGGAPCYAFALRMTGFEL